MKMMVIPPQRAAGLMAALAVILFAVIWPPEAGAYVPEGPHILALTAKAMGKLATLQIEQKRLIYPPSADAFPTVRDETVTYVMPRRFRSDIVTDRTKRTVLDVGDQTLTVDDGRVTPDLDPFDVYQRLLRSRTRVQLMKTLNKMGVETAISSLGRIDESVVFVLGAHYPDESASQLAVDKATFLPLRLLLTNGKADPMGERLDIYYHDWQKVQDGWFPTQVVFFHNGRLEMEIRTVRMRVNPAIPAQMMDPEALKASVAMTHADSLPEQKQEAVDAIRQGVQDFQKKFE